MRIEHAIQPSPGPAICLLPEKGEGTCRKRRPASQPRRYGSQRPLKHRASKAPRPIIPGRQDPVCLREPVSNPGATRLRCLCLDRLCARMVHEEGKQEGHTHLERGMAFISRSCPRHPPSGRLIHPGLKIMAGANAANPTPRSMGPRALGLGGGGEGADRIGEAAEEAISARLSIEPRIRLVPGMSANDWHWQRVSGPVGAIHGGSAPHLDSRGAGSTTELPKQGCK
jgi:hypothetical protein